MNWKLFMLIHNERSYKRYYYQPLLKDNCINRLITEIKRYCINFLVAAYLPFNPKYNKQQFFDGGGEKV